MSHHCPLCGYFYYCPCRACNQPKDPTLPKWKNDGDFQWCPICGLYLHLDMWSDIEMEQYENFKKESSKERQ